MRRPPAPTRHRAATVVVALALAALTACSSSSAGDGGASTTTAPGDAVTSTTVLAVAVDPSDGCGTKPDVAAVAMDQRPGDVEATFDSAGVERRYRLGVPPGYDPEVAVPLVVNLHGSGSNALQASAYGDVPRAAAERGMVVVAPEAIDGKWELAGTGADAEFIDALVDDIESRYCIDRNRVHLVGMSLGAWKAAATACASGDRYASVALVTVEVFPGTCRPLPVVAFHGTADRTVPYGEGGGPVNEASPNAALPDTLPNMAAWADNGGCDPEPEITAVGDDVELRRFSGCDPGIDVELYTIEGGGHTWPGSDVNLGPPSETTHTIDATELALNWFEAHPRQP